ncbi:hypothetical protein DPMN_128916 [Dreissena polymorpha]|uniref:C-type lectin domain-containing protein n=1 Tax=Dreissena polymorpha TaxID=45954 RepID=A0A9D4H1P8_DREPO|nr:hypothetical protein DPMN_128916 [Dreissena polymorpha]
MCTNDLISSTHLVAGHGMLIEIQDRLKQDYIVRLLAKRPNVTSIWIGLTDSETEGATAEGQWKWASGHQKLSSFKVC